jgi:superfamily II DNA or RNA helicase
MDVDLSLFNPITIKIQTEDIDYLDMMRQEFTRAVPNFQWTKAYKSGYWNGRVSMIDQWKSTFPYGLLMDYIRIHRKMFPRYTLSISPEVKRLFKGPTLDIKYDLKLKPRPYQKDCIEASLEYTKGIIRSATASGKSLVIAYIIRNLFRNKIIKKSIIIVPSTGLITQFFQDLVDYDFDSKDIGAVYSRRKQWNRKIVISTWQSLAKNTDKLDVFGCIIADETHGAKANEMRKILMEAQEPQYRLGFTGTMHSGSLDNWNTKSYLGPIIREYPSGLLAEQGYVSKCTVNMVNIEYDTLYDGVYHDVRDGIFQNPFRLSLLKKLVRKLDHNVLILVDKVEKEGELLRDYLMGGEMDKEIVFLSGRDDLKLREKWRKECMKRKDIGLIATYGIFQQGINIPNLKYIILASPFKAKIRVLQSIGRALRKHADKEDGAFIFDIHDHTKFFAKYGIIRERYYHSEKFEVKDFVVHEGDSLDDFDFLQ